jgi:hypothetical protein
MAGTGVSVGGTAVGVTVAVRVTVYVGTRVDVSERTAPGVKDGVAVTARVDVATAIVIVRVAVAVTLGRFPSPVSAFRKTKIVQPAITPSDIARKTKISMRLLVACPIN